MTQLDLNIHLRQIYLRQHLGCQKIHSKTSFKNTFSDCWEGKKRNKNTPPPLLLLTALYMREHKQNTLSGLEHTYINY